MSTLDSWKEEAIICSGPGSDIVRYRLPNGQFAVVLRYHEYLQNHPQLGAAMSEVLPWCSSTNLSMVADLAGCDLNNGQFGYIVRGTLLANLLQQRAPSGTRAALELVVELAAALDDIAETGKEHAVYNHGSLTPWRLFVTSEGEVTIIGTGIPQVAAIAYLDEQSDKSPPNAFRYCPPERIEDRDEDARTDIYCLALIAAQMTLGHPVLQQDSGESLIDMILDGGVEAELRNAAEHLPGPFVAWIVEGLQPSMEQRPRSATAWAKTAQTLLEQSTGSSLAKWCSGNIDEVFEEAFEEAFAEDDPTQIADLPTPMVRANEAPKAVVATDPQTESLPSLPPPLPDPRPGSPISAYQELAAQIIARTRQLADFARNLKPRIESKAASEGVEAEQIIQETHLQVDRAEHSAMATASAAKMLALDQDIAGASITMDLVRNGETQCQQAAQAISRLFTDLNRRIEQRKGQERALDEAKQQAANLANHSAEDADHADNLVIHLERRAKKGEYHSQGIDEALDHAVDWAEKAHSASKDAAAHSEAAAKSTRLEEAQSYVDRTRISRQRAAEAWAATQDVAARIDQMEEQILQDTRDRVIQNHTLTVTYLAEAKRSFELGKAALEGVRLEPEAQNAFESLKLCQQRCEQAESSARQAVENGNNASTVDLVSPFAREASQHAEAALDHSEEANRAASVIIDLAGAIAKAKAALAQATGAAERVAAQARQSTQRARLLIDRVIEETSTVSNPFAIEERSRALEAVQRAEDALSVLESELPRVVQSTSAQRIYTAMERLERQQKMIEGAATLAETHITASRKQAEDELAEQRRRKNNQAAVQRAADLAAEYSKNSAFLVSKASNLLQTHQESLDKSRVEAIQSMREKAVEIIDIARFQAGEAMGSAQLATQQTDPSEAQAHAATAKSFLDRIQQDLPEAHDLIIQAANQAAEDELRRQRAMQATEDTLSEMNMVMEQFHEIVALSQNKAQQWPSLEIGDASMSQFDRVQRALLEDRTEIQWAFDRIRQIDVFAEGEEVLQRAEATLQGARDNLRKAKAIYEQIERSIAGAEAEAKEVAEIQEKINNLLPAFSRLQKRIAQYSTNLQQSIKEHQAKSLSVVNAQVQLSDAAEHVGNALRQVPLLINLVQEQKSAIECRNLWRKAEGIEAGVRRAADLAAEAEAAGISAASQEAEERLIAEQERLEASKETVRLHSVRADDALTRIRVELKAAGEEAQGSSSVDARRAFEKAKQATAHLALQVKMVQGLATQALNASSAEYANRLGDDAEQRADDVVRLSHRVQEAIQASLDMTRAAAVEAKALDQVRKEVRALVRRADHAVDRTKTATRTMLSILDQLGGDANKDLPDQATNLIQAATKSAQKAGAAVPLTKQATSLDMAQQLLKTTRISLERTEESADRAERLVTVAQNRLNEVREHRARVFAEARAKAKEPLHAALAAKTKAAGWLEQATSDVQSSRGTPSVKEALQRMSDAASSVNEACTHAEQIVAQMLKEEDVGTITSYAAKVEEAVSNTVEHATKAKRCLDEVRQSIVGEKESLERIESLQAESSIHASTARRACEQATSSLNDIIERINSLPRLTPKAQQFFQQMKNGAASAEEGAERTAKAARAADRAKSVLVVEALVEEAASGLDEALDGLERVAAGELKIRKEIEIIQEGDRAAKQVERQRQQARVTAKQEEEARKKLEEESEKETARKQREEARRERFERRRAERKGRPAANDRQTLRDRLKQSRQVSRDEDEHTQIGHRPRRRSGEHTSAREVRSWAPRRADAPRRREKEPKARPEQIDESSLEDALTDSGSPADRLLERLRQSRDRR